MFSAPDRRERAPSTRCHRSAASPCAEPNLVRGDLRPVGDDASRRSSPSGPCTVTVARSSQSSLNVGRAGDAKQPDALADRGVFRAHLRVANGDDQSPLCQFLVLFSNEGCGNEVRSDLKGVQRQDQLGLACWPRHEVRVAINRYEAALGATSARMPTMAGSPASHSTAPSPSHALATRPTGRMATVASEDRPCAGERLGIEVGQWIRDVKPPCLRPSHREWGRCAPRHVRRFLVARAHQDVAGPGRRKRPLTSTAAPLACRRNSHHGPPDMTAWSAMRALTCSVPRSNWTKGLVGSGQVSNRTS